jgi:hypothetical protein
MAGWRFAVVGRCRHRPHDPRGTRSAKSRLGRVRQGGGSRALQGAVDRGEGRPHPGGDLGGREAEHLHQQQGGALVAGARRPRRWMASRQTLVVTVYIQARVAADVRTVDMPRQARTIASCTASSASWTEPSMR